jgi:hypothetical protein
MARKPITGIAPVSSEPVASNSGDDLGGAAIVAASTDASGIVSPGDLTGNGGDNGDEFERDEFGAVKRNADGSPRKRRGRKPGGGTGTGSGKSSAPRKASEVNLNGLEAILLNLHGMAAVAFKAQEFALEKKEAEQLATALAAVADHYPMTIAPKTLAWINLVMASSAIYGPRIYLYRQRVNKERDEKDNSESGSFMPGGFAGINGVNNLQ